MCALVGAEYVLSELDVDNEYSYRTAASNSSTRLKMSGCLKFKKHLVFEKFLPFFFFFFGTDIIGPVFSN